MLSSANILYSHFLDDRRCLITLLSRALVTHVYEEHNFLADKLVIMGLEATRAYSFSLQLFDQAPTSLVDLLQVDKTETLHLRRICNIFNNYVCNS